MLQVFEFLKFWSFSSSLPHVLWFQEKAENEIIMTSRNDLHKLTIVIFGKTPKALWVKASKMVRWSFGHLVIFWIFRGEWSFSGGWGFSESNFQLLIKYLIRYKNVNYSSNHNHNVLYLLTVFKCLQLVD